MSMMVIGVLSLAATAGFAQVSTEPAHSTLQYGLDRTSINDKPNAEDAFKVIFPEPTADENEVLKSTMEARRRLGLHGHERDEMKGRIANLQKLLIDSRDIDRYWMEFKVLSSSDILREGSGLLVPRLLQQLDEHKGKNNVETRKHIIDALAVVGDETLIPRLQQIEKSDRLFYMGSVKPDGPLDSILTDAGVAHNAILRIEGRARFLRDVHTKRIEELIDGLIFDLKHVRYLEHESETNEVRSKRYRLHSKELILVFVRLGRLVTPRLVHLLARHIEYEEQIDGVCRKQKDWNLSGKCIANAGLSHQDIFGYESGPIYQLIP